MKIEVNERIIKKKYEKHSRKSNPVKLDVGFKRVLRVFRKTLRNLFERYIQNKSFYHFPEEKFVNVVHEFMNKGLNLKKELSQRNACILTLMVYPTFGPT